jgi:hypothetical protein
MEWQLAQSSARAVHPLGCACAQMASVPARQPMFPVVFPALKMVTLAGVDARRDAGTAAAAGGGRVARTDASAITMTSTMAKPTAALWGMSAGVSG